MLLTEVPQNFVLANVIKKRLLSAIETLSCTCERTCSPGHKASHSWCCQKFWVARPQDPCACGNHHILLKYRGAPSPS